MTFPQRRARGGLARPAAATKYSTKRKRVTLHNRLRFVLVNGGRMLLVLSFANLREADSS